jgi:hypothetical protein
VLLLSSWQETTSRWFREGIVVQIAAHVTEFDPALKSSPRQKKLDIKRESKPAIVIFPPTDAAPHFLRILSSTSSPISRNFESTLPPKSKSPRTLARYYDD